MTNYKVGDFITAKHPDGYTVSGPLVQSASGVHLVLGLPAYPRYTPNSLQADGYTITPGKPADLSNPTDAQVKAAIDAYRRAPWGDNGMEAALKAAAAVGEPEPEPEPVKVPTGTLATVQNTVTGTLWSQLSRGRWFAVIDGGEPIEADDSEIANVLANGGKVLNEGAEL
ncbi:MAG TPA: hypothetical protein VFU07_05375 [Candidatus Lumbricidophila sp.]|nr:hypothetical protein [Candidatus Lumbricidophila sp.]